MNKPNIELQLNELNDSLKTIKGRVDVLDKKIQGDGALILQGNRLKIDLSGSISDFLKNGTVSSSSTVENYPDSRYYRKIEIDSKLTKILALLLSGTGTVGKLVKWVGAMAFGDSIVSESGTALTVGGSVKADSSVTGSVSNNTSLDTTGHQTMAGDARPWRDELGDALSLKVVGTGISLDATEMTINFDYNSLYASDYIYKNVQLNHDKDLSCSIFPHIHWFQAKNYVPNILLEYRWQKNLGEKTTAWTKLKCVTPAIAYSGTTKNQIYGTASGIAVPVGTTLSDIIQFKIYRDTNNASGEFAGNCPYNTGGNASVPLLAFDLHFQLNSIGSTYEYSK